MELTKEAILDAGELLIDRVDTHEWGECTFVYVRELTGDERDRVEQQIYMKHSSDDPDWRGTRAVIVAAGLCNADGESLGFTELEVKKLGQKGSAVLDRLHDRIRELSGMTKEADESSAKNSQTDQNESSG